MAHIVEPEVMRLSKGFQFEFWLVTSPPPLCLSLKLVDSVSCPSGEKKNRVALCYRYEQVKHRVNAHTERVLKNANCVRTKLLLHINSISNFDGMID